MLSVIVETGEDAARLPGLLAALTSAAVDGLVREVTLVGGPADLLAVLREETGAEVAEGLAQAIGAAKSERLLVLPARLRLRADWLADLGRHLREGGQDALLVGEGGPLSGRGYGVLIGRTAAKALARPDLKGLRRNLGRGAVRLA